MPRRYEIDIAFSAAVMKNPKGYLWLRSDDFIRELRARNWHFTQAEANKWIERYQPDFVDKTPDLSENRYWILRNMGRIH
ncbi:hypothetical protein CHU32_13605 [Superficieibacter electus]|uniref:DNA polymerase V n=1 Tax=Superficieibacter electus TaxID=2022662 RepID=A0A2P5GP02_9ENTR|nr:hypothetical protein [Superficieibacter electus]POP44916.1 hypothetical protein CHU33_10680 [Superficieibacter electus]POP48303.1 hypothetical protein CHU32_13605 [Superficieibacter electus]